MLLKRMVSDKFCFGADLVQYDTLVGSVQASSVQCYISNTVNNTRYV